MKKIKVRKGSYFIIFDGPSPISLEHSLFDEQMPGERRKFVRFGISLTQPQEEDYILKFELVDGSLKNMEVVIVASIRKNPVDPICSDWVLWTFDGGIRCIIHYSTATRCGSGKYVDEFPEY